MTNYTANHLAALQDAIASGAMEIEYDGPNGRHRTRYRSFDQMLKLEEKLKRELGLAPKPDFGVGYAPFDRGTGR